MSLLITGAKGFLGEQLVSGNKWVNCKTLDFGGCDYNVDISSVIPAFNESFVLVVHTAGKAHTLPRNKQEEEEFYRVNYQGTLNLLKGLSTCPQLPSQFIFISTVAVYGLEEGEMIDETHPLKGTSAYARSKIMAEEAVQEWAAKNGVPAIILRLPLIAGPNAPGNLGHMLHAIRKGYYFRIGSGSARRSMVLASDLADFLPSLKNQTGIYHLTDGIHPSYRELEDYIASYFQKKIRSVPELLIKTSARLGDFLPFLPIHSSRLKKLTRTLTFSDQKARKELNWTSRPVVGNFL